MPTCQAKLSDRAPCPKEVTHLFTQYCRWHDPLDLTWQELYEQLSKATLEEKVEIILEAIIDHPEHRLVLPEKYGVVVDLSTI
ncbi:MAG TPA: hypothetical protein VJ821_13455, partial [Anaerolineales bacterium]|nr:hypothetical protein [Anaerolineales bacterium]